MQSISVELGDGVQDSAGFSVVNIINVMKKMKADSHKPPAIFETEREILKKTRKRKKGDY